MGLVMFFNGYWHLHVHVHVSIWKKLILSFFGQICRSNGIFYNQGKATSLPFIISWLLITNFCIIIHTENKCAAVGIVTVMYQYMYCTLCMIYWTTLSSVNNTSEKENWTDDTEIVQMNINYTQNMIDLNAYEIKHKSIMEWVGARTF